MFPCRDGLIAIITALFLFATGSLAGTSGTARVAAEPAARAEFGESAESSPSPELSGALEDPRGHFEAEISGYLEGRVEGDALFFDTGNDSMPGFVLYLDAPERSVIILTRDNGALPLPGAYPVRRVTRPTGSFKPDDFCGTLTWIAGEEPNGYVLFGSAGGSVTITRTEQPPGHGAFGRASWPGAGETPDRGGRPIIEGTFFFHAVEHQSRLLNPAGELRRIAVSGSFQARRLAKP